MSVLDGENQQVFFFFNITKIFLLVLFFSLSHGYFLMNIIGCTIWSKGIGWGECWLSKMFPASHCQVKKKKKKDGKKERKKEKKKKEISSQPSPSK